MTDVAPSPDRRLVLVLAFDRAAGARAVEQLGAGGAHVPQPAGPDGVPEWVARQHRRTLTGSGLHPLDPTPRATVTLNDARVAEIRSWLEVHFVGASTVVVADPLLAWFEPGWVMAAAELGAQVDVVIVVPAAVADVVAAVSGEPGGEPVPPPSYAGAVALLLRAAATPRTDAPRVVKAPARRRSKAAEGAPVDAIPADLRALGDRALAALRDPASADVEELLAGYDSVVAAAGSSLAAPPIEATPPSTREPAGRARATGPRRVVCAARRRAVPERLRRRTRVWASDRAEQMARAALRALHR